MGPFVVVVADLLNRPGTRRRERVGGPLPGVAVTGGRIAGDGPASVDAVLESVSDGILVSGTVDAPWEGECRRCLAPVRGELRSEVRELFERHPIEGETSPLGHDHIDLEPLTRETLLLELPLAPLCSDACRGICPSCGANLNQAECRCPAVERDPRWAALDALRGDGPQH